MVSPMRRGILLWLLILCGVAAAQQTAPSKLPICAQLCLKSAFATNVCSPKDQACICTNAAFQHSVTKCVTTSCTIPEGLATKNISLTSCGAPVRDRGHEYIVLTIVMLCFAVSFVVMRFVFKSAVSRSEIGYDDWCVVGTLIPAFTVGMITIFGVIPSGLGRDIWTLEPAQITQMLKYFYSMAALYFTEIAMLKLTMLFFYLRVFPSREVQRILWGTIVFTFLWGFTYVVVAIFQCRPISYFWTQWDGLHHGTCLDINAIAESNAVISIVLDFWSLGVPLWQLWGLKMHWKKKVGVTLMFCVGTFVTIVSMLRLNALIDFAATTNVSWGFYDVSFWSTIEISVGIVCTSLPTLRLLLVRLFPILGGSSSGSSKNYYNARKGEGNNNKLKILSSKHSLFSTNTTTSGLTTGDFDDKLDENLDDKRITVNTTYTVKRANSRRVADTDEASLVSHEGRQST